MKIKSLYTYASLLLATAIFTACKKDGNPNNLPSVSPDAYVGKIDGFNSSDEVFPDNLIAYWSFDDTKNEIKTGTAPTTSVGDTYVSTGAVRGKALGLTAGFLHYATQFQKFRTDSIRSWSLSMWVKVRNNGTRRTMVFQLARPNIFNGNINVALNTQSYAATNDSVIRLQPTFATNNSITGTSMQDNLNNVLDKFNLNNWLHVVLTYDYTTGVFNNWINGVRVGNFPNRGTGGNSFRSWEPNQVFFGANFNAAGMPVSTDASFAPMTGQLDEVRFFNRTLPDAFIRALYNLGVANK